jgi:adenylate cyclase
MNAPPSIDPVTAHSDSDVVHWLTNETRDERFIDNIFAELCIRLQRAGIPVKRATLHVLIHHPQWLGARIMWADGMRETELARVDYDVRERSEYIGSPANERVCRLRRKRFRSRTRRRISGARLQRPN